jgi:hypothetical protein
MREKFDRQRYLFNAAIWHGDLGAVRREATRMVTAWLALDKAATAAGKAAISPLVWEVALADGTVAAIVSSDDHARSVIAEGRSVAVYTLDEIARLLSAYPDIAKAKLIFPGAEVITISRASATRSTPSATALTSTTRWTISAVQPALKRETVERNSTKGCPRFDAFNARTARAQPKIRPSCISTSTSEGPPMPKPIEIIAALGDISGIDSYAMLQAHMVDLFTTVADGMKWNHERAALIMREMAATVETVPYDVLAEFGYNYDEALITALLLRPILYGDVPDYADAPDLVLTLLDELRRIDLDHPDTQKAIDLIHGFCGRPNPRAPSER